MEKDVQIRDDVLEELELEPRIDETQIGVAVTNGVVTLSGYVDTYAAKIAAEQAAKRVKNVRAVALDIEVRLAGDAKYDDAEIAEHAANVLSWQVSPPKDGVRVKVENGWVTLNGEVKWGYQRRDAEQTIRNLAGVVGVTNLIAVGAGLNPRDVQARIKKAFHRNAELHATGINIAVDSGRVTLTGAVKGWHEREAAKTAAWAVPGVTQVVDNLAIH